MQSQMVFLGRPFQKSEIAVLRLRNESLYQEAVTVSGWFRVATRVAKPVDFWLPQWTI